MSIQEIREFILNSSRNHRKSSTPFLTSLFKTMDVDHSKQVDFYEFKAGLERLGVTKRFNENVIRDLFNSFDEHKTGSIDYSQFVSALKPPLSNARLMVINEAFEKLDINKDGVLSIEDFQKTYIEQAKQHPKYLSKEWDINQVLRSFLDAFDTPGNCDGIVTKDEFMKYYSVISATISDDSYFDLLIRSCFGLARK